MATTQEQLLNALEELGERTEAMYAEAAMLRHEVRVVDEKRARMWLPIALMVVLGVILIFVALQNRENGRILVNCTTPGPDHECYQRGQDAQDKFFDILDDIRDENRALREEVSTLREEMRSDTPPSTSPAQPQVFTVPGQGSADGGVNYIVVPDDEDAPPPGPTTTTTTQPPCGRLEVSSRCPLFS